jgi:hypothetical protein
MVALLSRGRWLWWVVEVALVDVAIGEARASVVEEKLARGIIPL